VTDLNGLVVWAMFSELVDNFELTNLSFDPLIYYSFVCKIKSKIKWRLFGFIIGISWKTNSMNNSKINCHIDLLVEIHIEG